MKRWEGPAHGPLFAACALVVAIGCANVQAQEAPAAEEPATGAEQPTTGEVPADAAAEQAAMAAEQPTTEELPAETGLLAPEQLDILVSPVALYPDPLLVLVLQGSTFPVEVIAANRFLGKLAEQPELQPDPDWDTSIVGLLNYPDVLARMDEELDWTEALGEAVLNQLDDVQGSIQQVRLQAYMAGMLATNEQQIVTGSPTLIIVLPADQTQIFVPSYDPAAVLAAAPVPLAPVEAAAEAPAEPEVAEEPAPAEPESVEAVEAPVEPAPETYVEPETYVVPASYQGPAPLPPVYASAPPVVQYSDPSPSFWTGAATFAGGAAIGGMLGYVIGDDDDDGNDWDYNDEDWDDIADDVDNIADDMDELNEGFEDFREDAGERADELAGQREERADQLQQSSDERADQREAAAQNREKNKAELRDKQQKHQANQVQDQLRQRKGLPETGGNRAARQQVAALGGGSANAAGIAPASVKRRADAPGLAARTPATAAQPARQRRPDAAAAATRSPTLAKAEAARPAPRRPGTQVAAANPRSAITAPKPAREVKKQSVRGSSSRSSAKNKAVAQGGGQRTVARSDSQRRSAKAQKGGGRSKSAMASSHKGGSKVKKSSSRGKASRGGGGKRGGGGGRRR
jgi:Protein of unknown function (DUF3300)